MVSFTVRSETKARASITKNNALAKLILYGRENGDKTITCEKVSCYSSLGIIVESPLIFNHSNYDFCIKSSLRTSNLVRRIE